MADKSKKPKRKRLDAPLAKNFKALLEERGISQRGAAEIMGVSVAVVHDWLQGAYPNDPQAVLRFCRAVDCDFQWLLTGERSASNSGKANLSEMFDIQEEPDFSGIFMIEVKRLRKKGEE